MTLHTYPSGGGSFTIITNYYEDPEIAPRIGRTNYIGVAGSGGKLPGNMYDRFRGIFTLYNPAGNKVVRHSPRVKDIVDGTTKTLLFGEAVGGHTVKGRTYAYSWMGAGAMPTAWGLGPVRGYPNQVPMWVQFSSFHPGIVQFCFADNSVAAINIEIDDSVLDALAGYRDGVQVDRSQF